MENGACSCHNQNDSDDGITELAFWCASFQNIKHICWQPVYLLSAFSNTTAEPAAVKTDKLVIAEQ